MNADEAVTELKKHEPASLKVTLLDGTEKPVAVPRIRNRWSRVTQVLDALPWVRIEGLDKAGAVLATVEDDSEEQGLVDDGEASDLGIARVMLEVMRTTMKEQRLANETAAKGMAALVDALIGGVHAMSEAYQQAINVQRATAIADAAGSAAGGNPEILAMLQLAMQSSPQLAGGKKP